MSITVGSHGAENFKTLPMQIVSELFQTSSEF